MRRYLTTRRAQGREDSGEDSGEIRGRWRDEEGIAEDGPDEEGDGRLMTCPSIWCCSISAIALR